VALSSYGGLIQRAPYRGALKLGADCLGSMQQRDSRGSGYIYLQSDPNDQTLGLLQHQR